MKKLFLVLLCAFSIVGYAQKKSTIPVVPKKPLTHSVYDDWKEINYKAITPDGAFAAFTVNPQDGDGKAIFYNLKTNVQDSVKRASDILLTFDSKQAIFKIKPQQTLVKDLRRQKKKKEELPKDSLGIYTLATKQIEKVADVKSHKVPEKSGGWLAYQLDVKAEAKKSPKDKADTLKKTDPIKTKKLKKNSDENGYTLIVRKLSNGEENQFGFVKEYVFAKYGQGLLFATTGNDTTLKPGAYWYDLQKEILTQLHEGKSKYKYKGLSISEDGTQAAFLLDIDSTKAPIHYFKLYHWKNGDARASVMADEKSKGIPQDWQVSEHYSPVFSKNGSTLYLGTSPKPIVQDTTLLTEEIVNVEVWHGDDQYIYPQQNKQLESEKKRTYLAAINLSNQSLIQLASKEVPEIELGNEGNANVALGETNVSYRKMITWDPRTYKDFYLYGKGDGSRKTVATKIKGNANLSPKANYVYWFSLTDTAWFIYSVANEETININQNLKGKFADEEDDHPDYPEQYGSVGWVGDDQLFLVYDRYDIWAFDPENKKPPVNLTKIGRKEKTVFRYVKLDSDKRFIDENEEIILSAFNETTKASGYYKLFMKDGKLTKLVLDNARFGGIVKAKNSNQILFTRESFREFPDVWSSDLSFSSPKKISEANPQMKNYFWGSVEMVNWTSLDNIPLNGLLYKPEGFDPKKKYPMIVYFYEKESDNLNSHIKPEPLRSSINRSVYTSNGYLVFVPDIVYKIGFPGESAQNCIMPGVTSLIAKGFVDEKNIGIQGHSWGGYQTAYLITRTKLFKAAEAGAPVANMISAYGGIRWESGMSRMFQYEHSQTRLGGTLWEKPMLFIENSPIFFADKIQTPVLLLHNDADGAVPWYQGIEMYMALRRLNKPVWMLNYNGEPHWPVKRENRIDFQTRMMQFFDYYLKDLSKPEWMKNGVPAIEKGINKGY
ncbi:MAG: S9 family peptidase [Bacteroidia bacterium]|nr:S9 family peptidase [Bacteroidia bacterium]